MASSRIFAMLAAGLALFLAGAAPADATRRVALVIGNDDYRELPVLQKAGADATDFAEVLKEKQFDEVFLHKNLTRLQMDLAVSDFLETIAPGDLAVFFYSGHGWSDGAQNFLVGTDVPVTAGGVALARLSIPLQNGANGIIDGMAQQGATLKIVIVDACRDNPFQPEIAGRSIGMGRGLSRVQPPNGTFVIFSAGAGQVALDRLSDDDDNRNSVFTRTLLPLVSSDLPLHEVIKTTQEKVYQLARQVRHEQEPAYYDQVRGDACLSLSCRSGAAVPTEAAPPKLEPAAPSVGNEMKFWIAIQNSSNPAEYRAFLDRFPNSDLTALALIRLDAIEPAFWDASSSAGRSGLERYLGFYPDGRHAGEARDLIAALDNPPPEPVAEAPVVEAPVVEAPAAEEVTESSPPPEPAEEAVAEAPPPPPEPQAEAAVAEAPPPVEPEVEVALAEAPLPPEPATGEGPADAAVVDAVPVVEEAAPPADEPVVALADVGTPSGDGLDASGNVVLEGRDLIVALQEVLKRTGCYTSRIDGDWGRRSQRGLENFLRHSKVKAEPRPTFETLEYIQHLDEPVCPVVVAPPKPKRNAAAPRQRQRQQAAQPETNWQPQPTSRRQRQGGGGNPNAGCAGVLSPADPNFGSPGRATGSC